MKNLTGSEVSQVYCDTFEETKKINPPGVRHKFRNVALNCLSELDKLRSRHRYLDKPRVQFLYMHHVFKDEEANFTKLLDFLAQKYQFVSYTDAVGLILNARISKPVISISFDDGFKNNIRAAEILHDHAINACFFVDPVACEFKTYAEKKDYCEQRLHFPPVDLLNWKDIEILQKLGQEVGGHGFGHHDMALQVEDVLSEDLHKAFMIFQRKCGGVKHFAFPFGRFSHFSEAARKSVFAAGFTSCASAERGCHINPNVPLENGELCILRDHLFLDGNLNHLLHFMINNSKNANAANNFYPYSKN